MYGGGDQDPLAGGRLPRLTSAARRVTPWRVIEDRRRENGAATPLHLSVVSERSGIVETIRLVRPRGLEPLALGSATPRSIQLSYGRTGKC